MTMHIAFDGGIRIGTELSPGEIAITEAEYQEAMQGLLDGKAVSVSDGRVSVSFPPEPQPVVEPEEPFDITRVTLSPRQIRLGLLSAGVGLDAVSSAIASIPDPTVRAATAIEWEWAAVFRRDHPTIKGLTPILGLTEQQVDDLWLQASTL